MVSTKETGEDEDCGKQDIRGAASTKLQQLIMKGKQGSNVASDSSISRDAQTPYFSSVKLS